MSNDAYFDGTKSNANCLLNQVSGKSTTISGFFVQGGYAGTIQLKTDLVAGNGGAGHQIDGGSINFGAGGNILQVPKGTLLGGNLGMSGNATNGWTWTGFFAINDVNANVRGNVNLIAGVSLTVSNLTNINSGLGSNLNIYGTMNYNSTQPITLYNSPAIFIEQGGTFNSYGGSGEVKAASGSVPDIRNFGTFQDAGAGGAVTYDTDFSNHNLAFITNGDTFTGGSSGRSVYNAEGLMEISAGATLGCFYGFSQSGASLSTMGAGTATIRGDTSHAINIDVSGGVVNVGSGAPTIATLQLDSVNGSSFNWSGGTINFFVDTVGGTNSQIKVAAASITATTPLAYVTFTGGLAQNPPYDLIITSPNTFANGNLPSLTVKNGTQTYKLGFDNNTTRTKLQLQKAGTGPSPLLFSADSKESWLLNPQQTQVARLDPESIDRLFSSSKPPGNQTDLVAHVRRKPDAEDAFALI